MPGCGEVWDSKSPSANDPTSYVACPTASSKSYSVLAARNARVALPAMVLGHALFGERSIRLTEKPRMHARCRERRLRCREVFSKKFRKGRLDQATPHL